MWSCNVSGWHSEAIYQRVHTEHAVESISVPICISAFHPFVECVEFMDGSIPYPVGMSCLIWELLFFTAIATA